MEIKPMPQSIFDVVIIDTIGPLHMSENGNKYTVTIICDFFLFLVTKAIESDMLTFSHILYSLLYQPSRHGTYLNDDNTRIASVGTPHPLKDSDLIRTGCSKATFDTVSKQEQKQEQDENYISRLKYTTIRHLR